MCSLALCILAGGTIIAEDDNLMFLNENIQFFFFLPQTISDIVSDISPFKHRSYNWRGKT